MSLPTMIPVERLTPGVDICRKGGDFGPFGNAAQVTSIRFDGEGYVIEARLYDTDGADEWVGEDEVRFYVECAEKVQFYGHGIPPFLRPECDVTDEELEAKAEAHELAADSAIVAANKAAGYQVRPGVEALCVDAVADALGVTMAKAAE